MRGLARMHLPERQRGAALLILLALFAVAAAYMLVTSLNKGSVTLTLARSDKNRAVMREAKAALIAWAASETSQPAGGQGFQPGALPCPDINNDGTSDYSGLNCTGYLGRLPYKTLGITDLRDASGELLWYSVSSNFVRSTNNVINSDTQGTLSISGLAPASNVIAVVLAPGMRLGAQNRSPAGANTAANYLENTNGIANSTNYVTATENLTDPVVANLFNDQLLAITKQDLFSVVEPVVAARIQRDIVAQYIYNSDPSLTDSSRQWSDDPSQRNKSRYYDAWNAFPFAASFSDPSLSNFTGQAGTYEGLLPVVDSLNYTWSSPSATTGGTGFIFSNSCSTANGATDLRCSISYWSGQPTIHMSGTVNRAGFSFVQLPRLSDVTSSGGSLSSRSLSGSLTNTGAGIVTLDATLPYDSGFNSVTIIIHNTSLVASALTSTTSTDIAGWFNNNNWSQLTYYAVSPGYAPSGGGTCNAASPKCLRVNNLAPPYINPTTDTRALIILAGRSLTGNAHPTAAVTDYLEAQNAITAQNIVTGNYTFETGLGTVSSTGVAINDKVIVIAP